MTVLPLNLLVILSLQHPTSRYVFGNLICFVCLYDLSYILIKLSIEEQTNQEEGD